MFVTRFAVGGAPSGVSNGLELSSTIATANGTSIAVILPQMTTAQRDAMTPLEGSLIYNTTTPNCQRYKAGAWANF